MTVVGFHDGEPMRLLGWHNSQATWAGAIGWAQFCTWAALGIEKFAMELEALKMVLVWYWFWTHMNILEWAINLPSSQLHQLDVNTRIMTIFNCYFPFCHLFKWQFPQLDHFGPEVQTRTPQWKLARCLRLNDAKRHGALGVCKDEKMKANLKNCWKTMAFGKQPLACLCPGWVSCREFQETNVYNSWASLLEQHVIMMMKMASIDHPKKTRWFWRITQYHGSMSSGDTPPTAPKDITHSVTLALSAFSSPWQRWEWKTRAWKVLGLDP